MINENIESKSSLFDWPANLSIESLNNFLSALFNQYFLETELKKLTIDMRQAIVNSCSNENIKIDLISSIILLNKSIVSGFESIMSEMAKRRSDIKFSAFFD